MSTAFAIAVLVVASVWFVVVVGGMFAIRKRGLDRSLSSLVPGVDLIVYSERDVDEFVARPVQLKAFSGRGFSIDRKYAKTADLLMAYVWNIDAEAEPEVFVMTFEEAVELATEVGFTSTSSWIEHGKYAVTRPSESLVAALSRYRATPRRWNALLG